MLTLNPIFADPINFAPYGQLWQVGRPVQPTAQRAEQNTAQSTSQCAEKRSAQSVLQRTEQNTAQSSPRCATPASHMSSAPLPRPLRLGLTYSTGGSFICDQMERHNSTEEYLFSGESEIILAVSDSPPQGQPHSESIKAFRLPPGTVVSLRPGIWHAACHSPGMDSFYYFMAHNNGQPDETKWFHVIPEAVAVNCEGLSDCANADFCEDALQSISAIYSGGTNSNTLSNNKYKASCFHEHVPAPLPRPEGGTAQPCNIVHTYKTNKGKPLAEHIIFQDENVCTGDTWKCWMTDTDCYEGNARLYFHPLTSSQTAYVTDIAAVFCGNCELTCQIVAKAPADASGSDHTHDMERLYSSDEARLNSGPSSTTQHQAPITIHLVPGELLKLTDEADHVLISVTAPTDDTPFTDENTHWFYTISSERCSNSKEYNICYLHTTVQGGNEA